MALPERIRVKLSSETAEAISITRVLVQDLAMRELIEHMLGVAGKDEPRIREMLLRGTLVSGASRFRWEGWEADPEGLREMLATFPDADPARPFAPGRCVRAVLRGGRQTIELPREALMKKPMFARGSFWDAFVALAAEGRCTYTGYSYRDRADRYAREFSVAETERLRAAAKSVKFRTLRERIEAGAFGGADLFVGR
jgi:hypothetical protein